MKKLYMKMLMPGVFMPEESDKEVRIRDVKMVVPNNVYAYYFYEREVTESKDGETLKGKPKNMSGRYYPGGTTYSLEEIKARNDPNDRNLIDLMKWEKCKVVQTRLGNWQPFYPDKDVVV